MTMTMNNYQSFCRAAISTQLREIASSVEGLTVTSVFWLVYHAAFECICSVC